MKNRHISTLITASACLLLLSPAATAAAQSAPTRPAPASHPAPDMVQALADTLGVTSQQAIARLNSERDQQHRLADLAKHGITVDGAFFDSRGKLIVNTPHAADAAAVTRAGLDSRIPERGERVLDRVKAALDAAAARQVPSGIDSWEVDLPSDTVTITAHDTNSATARSFLHVAQSFADAVHIVKSPTTLAPQTTIAPGSKMTFNGYYCSVGFGAHSSSGTQYLVTAGHCVKDLPDLYYSGSHFAKGVATRYRLGQPSVDMGLARLDSGVAIATRVGTWGALSESPAVKGSTRALPGASLCKSGATSHWTCGKVKSYNVTVTYSGKTSSEPDTVVSGLGSSTVCTEGGDSGGAYISGDQAQGLTSGGPLGQTCDGVNSAGTSYFQPLDDVLSYYGLTLNTN
ncbi:S1 family peptidase [Streptomyces sp. NPDC006393]|uniref:S1 family peptidase n=1 Tax=Streptomyces sp. NPDC006393 TaxID=3156763 RepID=UPI00340EE50F